MMIKQIGTYVTDEGIEVMIYALFDSKAKGVDENGNKGVWDRASGRQDTGYHVGDIESYYVPYVDYPAENGKYVIGVSGAEYHSSVFDTFCQAKDAAMGMFDPGTIVDIAKINKNVLSDLFGCEDMIRNIESVFEHVNLPEPMTSARLEFARVIDRWAERNGMMPEGDNPVVVESFEVKNHED